jgi:hypothetical protein
VHSIASVLSQLTGADGPTGSSERPVLMAFALTPVPLPAFSASFLILSLPVV